MKKVLSAAIIALMIPSMLFAGGSTKTQWLRLLPTDNKMYLAKGFVIDNDSATTLKITDGTNTLFTVTDLGTSGAVTSGLTVPSGSTLTLAAGSTLVSTGMVVMQGITGALGLDVTYGITGGSITTAGNMTMGSASVDAGVFSMIKGTTGSDPTFSITQEAANVAIAETVGDIGITAADDITITATGANISLVGATAVTGALSTTGAMVLYSRTEAELKALAPPSAGAFYFDSTNVAIVVSSGTGTGAFVHATTGGTTLPTGW
jgi:hypothetical protein